MVQEDRPQKIYIYNSQKLLITNLADEVTDDDLRTMFQSCGEIIDVHIKKNDRDAFAFVIFSSLEEAEKPERTVIAI